MEISNDNLKSSSTSGVRIVGNIRPFLESEDSGASHVEVSRIDSDCALISFGDQSNRKDNYKLDWCYGQDEDMQMVFSKEIIPLVHEVIEGNNSCVIAYGAQGSGKTQLIKGSEENPGLALMTISKILSTAEKLNGLVAISCYEIHHDRVYDLLDPNVPEVFVMEDAGRKIMLKGLSQVPVKSTSDFMGYYIHGCNERKSSQKGINDFHGFNNERKSSQKGINEVATRSHKGLIITVSYVDEKSKKSCIGKMSFVDLAGYEDTKRNIFSKPTFNEITRVNKSLYALLNVICSLNRNEKYVPYRETKLTHLLQDFLCKPTNAVLFTCLNPKPCQDTSYVVCLASRSCQVVNKSDSAKNNKSALRTVQSSPLNGKVGALESSIRALEISQSVEKFSPFTVRRKHKISSSAEKFSSLTMKSSQPLSLSQKKLGIHASSMKKVGIPGSPMKKVGIPGSPMKKAGIPGSPMKKASIPGSPMKKVGIVGIHCSPMKKTNEISSATKGRMMSNFKSKMNDSVKKQSKEDENVPLNASTKSPIAEEKTCREDEKLSSYAHTKSPTTKEICHGTKLQTEIKEESEVDYGLKQSSNDGSDDDQKQIMTVSKQHSPSITEKLKEISNSLRLASTKSMDFTSLKNAAMESMDPKTPKTPYRKSDETPTTPYLKSRETGTPRDILRARSTGLKKSLVQECLSFVNTATKEELVRLKHFGERRALSIIERREKKPFEDVEDIKKSLGIGSKQVNEMMSQVLGDF